MSLTAFRAALGDIPVIDDPKAVLVRTRDYYWYSPVLKASSTTSPPRSSSRPATKTRSRRRSPPPMPTTSPITPRGAGTGNYGQAMPLSRRRHAGPDGAEQGADIEPDRVRAEAGMRLERLDRETRAAVGSEIRFFPSTYKLATPRRLHRRRLGRRRLGPLGRPAGTSATSWGSRSSPARPTPRHAGPGRRGYPEGRPCLWHQRHHRRGRNAAGPGLRLGRDDRRLRRFHRRLPLRRRSWPSRTACWSRRSPPIAAPMPARLFHPSQART